MTSKINWLDTRPIQVGAGTPAKRIDDARSAPRDSQDASATSEVHITDSARHLAALERALGHQPEIDEAKVRSVRAALDEGRYPISDERIADKLLTLEKALAGYGPTGQEN